MRNLVSAACCAAMFLRAGSTFGQQETTFSQYMFNRAAYNPASVGVSPCLSFNAQYRHQWTSFPAAPRSFGANGHIGVPKWRSGFGAFMQVDVLGALNNAGLGLDYAFRIPVGEGSLALGLQAAMQIYGVDPNMIRYADPDDPLFLSANRTVVLPDFGTGVFFHNRRAYAGLSVLRLVEFPLPVYFLAKGTALRRHFFLTGGYDVYLNENVILSPSMLAKYVR
ncbi:MAG: PorP/SprF family type IX secretion system membrane protein, partial [Bacteroidia bacterium]|nr:PorP/SprF family type IX secretion system membrane protein [Bacteroidia bacterium]